MGRITRSFELVAQSYRILMQDKELMVLPLISGTIIASVVFSFFVGFGLTASSIEQHGPEVYIPVFVMYVATYAIGIFFQAAVIAGATERMRGGDPTVRSSIDAASRRLGSILMWAVVAATVGMIIRAIHDRVGFIGRIVTGLMGAAWSLATFFVVPVLVLEDLSIGDSVSRSVTVFKKTWGETAVGSASLGFAAFCAWMALIAVTVLLGALGVGLLAVFVFGTGAVLLMVLFSTLQGVYVASLFRYATEGQPPPGFDGALLGDAFVAKK